MKALVDTETDPTNNGSVIHNCDEIGKLLYLATST